MWEKVLLKTPPERLMQLRSDLRAAGAQLSDGYVPTFAVLPADERKARGCELALLTFLTMELTRQLIVKKEEDGSLRFPTPLPDTVLHEHGVRHNPFICQHCHDDGRLPHQGGVR